jgi:hypothetical protein
MGAYRENFDLLSPLVPCRLLSPRLSSLVAVVTTPVPSLVGRWLLIVGGSRWLLLFVRPGAQDQDAALIVDS